MYLYLQTDVLLVEDFARKRSCDSNSESVSKRQKTDDSAGLTKFLFMIPTIIIIIR